MADQIYDLIVIGAGPGGYVAAIRAAQLGFSVVVVERRATLGGVCLNEGCIPSKALLDSSEYFALARDDFARHGILVDPPRLDLPQMLKRKDEVVKRLTDGVAYLFKKQKIVTVTGSAKLGGTRGDGVQTVTVATPDSPAIPRVLLGKWVLLATGSEPVPLPGIPFDGDLVVSAREALAFSQVPEQLLVVGAGYIGLELGSVWRRLGSQVTVVEALAKPLPASDGQVAETIIKALKKQGMTFVFDATVTRVVEVEGRAAVTVAVGESVRELTFDKVLVAAGRRPATAGLGLAQVGVAQDDRGRIAVDADYRTTVPGIYAIGDLIPGPMLAHKAMEEGVAVAERLAGEAAEVDYAYIPGVVYTWPEAASVGQTEEQLREAGTPYAVGRYNFIGNGRARCLDETDGFVKVLAHGESGRLLGVHIVGPRASELIGEAVTAMSFGGTAADLGMVVHAHPSLSEAIKEAALDVQKRAIHG
jgi:dihydrolipoamide dehydrogenase